MEEVHIVLLFGVIRHSLHHDAASLGIGEADVGIQRHTAKQVTLAVDLGKVRTDFLRDGIHGLPGAVTDKAVRLSCPAMAHIVEVKATLLHLHFTLALPLEDGLCIDRLRLPGSVVGVVIVTLIVGHGDIELDHKGVHADLGSKVDDLHHILLVLAALIALATVTVVRLLAIGNRRQTFDDGDPLAVHTGEQPAAAAEPEIAVHSDQQSTGVGAGNDAALGIGLHIDDIVQRRILGIAGVQAEVLHQTQPEAGLCLGVHVDSHLTAAGHHHAKILLQLVRSEIHGGVQGNLMNGVHGNKSFPFSVSSIHNFPLCVNPQALHRAREYPAAHFPVGPCWRRLCGSRWAQSDSHQPIPQAPLPARSS